MPHLDKPIMRVAIFSGCAQDFIYPEDLEACVRILAARNVAVDFPWPRPAAACRWK